MLANVNMTGIFMGTSPPGFNTHPETMVDHAMGLFNRGMGLIQIAWIKKKKQPDLQGPYGGSKKHTNWIRTYIYIYIYTHTYLYNSSKKAETCLGTLACTIPGAMPGYACCLQPKLLTAPPTQSPLFITKTHLQRRKRSAKTIIHNTIQRMPLPHKLNWSCQTVAHCLLSCGSCGFWVG